MLFSFPNFAWVMPIEVSTSESTTAQTLALMQVQTQAQA